MNTTSHARRSRGKRIPVNVGEDITAPVAVARDGRIRIRSERAATVARWFGLGRAGREDASDPPSGEAIPTTIVPPAAGTILLITGPSGAGKSTLLRELRRCVDAPTRPWIDLASMSPLLTTTTATDDDRPLVDCFGDATPLREVLLLLSRVGLGEAWTYLRPPAELSEGQAWRFKLALALHAATSDTVSDVDERSENSRPILACDEFAAVLDRVTALVVARCLRRAIDANPRLAAVVATAHDDLQPALRPDAIAYCDFGRVEYRRLDIQQERGR